jgi:DNA-directed RNA polymerase specialized sigma24 family protein
VALSYPQIAAVLGCAESTTRSYIHRALSALRESIEKETSDD